jgi:hypothetical protein
MSTILNQAVFAKPDWMYGAPAAADGKLSANELTSLSALIAHLAQNSGENVFRIERRLADRFNVPNVTCLPHAQFDDALCYLTAGAA